MIAGACCVLSNALRTAMPAFVPVPSKKIEAALKKGGFKRDVAGDEVVYTYPHKKHRDLFVHVYTTIGAKANTPIVRGPGKDAIRVAVVWKKPNGETRGITRTKRVNCAGTEEGCLVE